MKKIINLLYMIFVILMCYITKNVNMILFTISFGMYILFMSFFSTTSIKNIIGDNLNYKSIRYSFLFVFIIGIIMSILSFGIGYIIGIDKLCYVNIAMSISVISNVLIKMISDYLEILGYKKIGSFLPDIYKLSSLGICFVGIILLYKVFEFSNYINIIVLFSVNTFVFVVLAIMLYVFLFRNIKNKKILDDKGNNYLLDIKKIIVLDSTITGVNIVKSSYIYTSIIITYFSLVNKYNYSYEMVGTVITDIYFYGLLFVYFIYKFIKKIFDKENNIVMENIVKKDKKLNDNFNNLITKVVKLSLNICIVLLVISGPISRFLFGSDVNIIFDLVPLLLFYTLYDVIVNLLIVGIKNKNLFITLFSGLIVKLLFEYVLITSVYRMGYNLTFGSILSIVLGFAISVIIGIILIKNKYKLNLLSYFDNILNVIYENILLCLVLVLFTLIVDVNSDSKIINLLVIFFYIFISIIFFIVKRVIERKRAR